MSYNWRTENLHLYNRGVCTIDAKKFAELVSLAQNSSEWEKVYGDRTFKSVLSELTGVKSTAEMQERKRLPASKHSSEPSGFVFEGYKTKVINGKKVRCRLYVSK